MHWIVQKNIFKPENFRLLTDALETLKVDYTPVIIRRERLELDPEVNPNGRVYVCGANRMAKIAEERKWIPGSFLNDQFNFNIWKNELGEELLNFDIAAGKLGEIDTTKYGRFFIRPLEDTKSFDGMVIDNEMLSEWRNNETKRPLLETDVIVSSVKDIYREYRLFIVKKRLVTGSVYKVSGKPQISNLVDPAIEEYANGIIEKWLPIESCVMDVCVSDQGIKVIEFNNINSSSFYACDVQKYVHSIQDAYS